jgi:adenosylcobinamide-GDP ribazoletransferase
VRLALSWLTVLPIDPRVVDARAGRRAIALAPLVGVLLGAGGAAVMLGVGAFAVVALIVTVGIQATALASVHWGVIILAFTAGRAAFSWCCRHGMPAARPDGLGALVAGSQPLVVPVAWFWVLACAAIPVVPERLWQGPLAVLVAAAVLVVFTEHVRKRLGGITGDVLGAACELTTTVILLVCAL